MLLTTREQTIVSQIFETPFIKAKELVRKEPCRVLFFIEYSLDSLTRQLKHCINKKSDSDLISTYQEKIAELIKLQDKIAENIDTKHLKTSYVC